jgi:hypothetical protein
MEQNKAMKLNRYEKTEEGERVRVIISSGGSLMDGGDG